MYPETAAEMLYVRSERRRPGLFACARSLTADAARGPQSPRDASRFDAILLSKSPHSGTEHDAV